VSLKKSVQDGQQQTRLKKKDCKIHQIMRANRRRTVGSIAEQVNIDRETVRKIVTEDLGMRKVYAKRVPKELTEEQKQRRVTICQDLLKMQNNILSRFITGDEIWV